MTGRALIPASAVAAAGRTAEALPATKTNHRNPAAPEPAHAPARRWLAILAAEGIHPKLAAMPPADAAAAAAADVAAALRGAGQQLPHLSRVQAAFGDHDLSGIASHSDPQASLNCRRVGARAFAAGERIAFDGAPSLGLVAHEAAHVIQQRAELPRRQSPEELEAAADHVSQRVAAGRSAVDLLPAVAPHPRSPDAARAVQFAPDPLAQEIERAATEMWQTINDINALGAEVEFVYYTSNGAMTLVSYQQTKMGSGAASSVDLAAFKRDTFSFVGGAAAGSTLATFVGTSQRYVSFTLDRAQGKWSLKAWNDVSAAHPKTPPEGREQPNSAAPGMSVDAFARITGAVAKWLPTMMAYPGGTVTMKFTASFIDDRLTDLQSGGAEYSGGKPPAFAKAASFTDLRFGSALRAFAQGLGERKIKFTMLGDAKSGETEWRVLEAAADRGPPPKLPDEAEAIMTDYRRMHAEIIQKWREGVQDAAIYAGMLGVEQLAFWLIGGVMTKGLGAAFGTVAPRLVGFIRASSKGGSRAGAQYLDTMIARLSLAERAEMQTLAKKAETEGLEALGKAERQSLERLLQKLESMIEAPLATAEKKTLRGRMGTRFLSEKTAVDAAFKSANRSYQIHHRLPLEWGHKFPGVDVNGANNLIALETEVHRGVNACWTRLRNSGKAARVDGNAATKAMDIVDKYFGKWYDKPPATSGAALEAEIQAAMNAAYAEIDALAKAL